MNQEQTRQYLKFLHGRLQACLRAGQTEAAEIVARTLLRQRDERGWPTRLAIALFLTPISKAIPAWRSLRSGLIPDWGADLDFGHERGEDTHLLAACRRWTPASAAILIDLGADPELRGHDGLSAVDHIKASHRSNPRAGWGAVLDKLASRGAMRERSILEQAIDEPVELQAAAPRARGSRSRL